MVIPENLYEVPSYALKVSLGCNMVMDKVSEYKDIYKLEKDGKKTVIDSELKKSE